MEHIRYPDLFPLVIIILLLVLEFFMWGHSFDGTEDEKSAKGKTIGAIILVVTIIALIFIIVKIFS